ncbi:light-regulated protein, chloroplastic-like [Miscanthus floridulus]|uniref:light-regulated protein, chloroplastic-like n=1 Tax=Miscanthus floridulus TaxID=154761 RepID=UPI00345A3852
MQAAATAVRFSAVLPTKARPAARSTVVARVPATRRSVRAAAAAAVVAEPAQVDYSSSFSVFPMEACDLLGGDACIGQMYPEAKLAAAAPEASRRVDGVERDYLSYDDPKTVFPGEACDHLGGEFCEAPYLDGVSRELAHARRLKT